jgi:aryl-alcohol dehydrogenase-like predicted oxidoreductase
MDSSPARLKEAVDKALKFLDRDVIDVVVQARQDPNVPIEDFMSCMKELVEAGAFEKVQR